MNKSSRRRIAFVGTVGIPNRYGGFEAFLEHTVPAMQTEGVDVVVTCDGASYPDGSAEFNGTRRVFIPCPANGTWSVLHDLLAFGAIFRLARCIYVLGVSGGIWFPLFRLACGVTGRCLIVNVDGIEWQRGKFSGWKRSALWLFDYLAQRFAHVVIIDNSRLPARFPGKTVEIAYPGDYVMRLDLPRQAGTALTVCRIEPENNIEMLIEGALLSSLRSYTVIGNWENSHYGRSVRARYADSPRLHLLDPVYDPAALARLRETCEFYVHGHSVGGTNPSLVEMLFYDCRICCYDVPFHHATAGEHASYFSTAEQLAQLLNSEQRQGQSRDDIRRRYTRRGVARQYLALCQPVAPGPAGSRTGGE